MNKGLKYWIIVVLLVVVSCQQNHKVVEEITKDTVVVDDKKNINSIGVILSSEAKEGVKSWSQYNAFSEFIKDYRVISNTEALNNALTLSQYADSLKTSIPPVMLTDDRVKARVNLLHSACLRLSDMSDISAITQNEIKQQVKQVLSTYAMLNTKINDVFDVHELESELSLDPDFIKMLKDLPKVQSTDTIIPKPTVKTAKKKRKTLDRRPLIKKRKRD